MNKKDVLINKKVKIIAAETIYDVVKEALVWGKKKTTLTKIKRVMS